MKIIKLSLLLLLALLLFTSCDYMNTVLGINDSKKNSGIPSIEQIEDVVANKDVVEITIIPEDDSTDSESDVADNGDVVDETDEIVDDDSEDEVEDQDDDVNIDYFEIYVNEKLIRTLYRYRRQGRKFGIGKIRVRKGDSVYWKYFQDGILIRKSSTVVLDSNSRKNLMVLYRELMYIYISGGYNSEE